MSCEFDVHCDDVMKSYNMCGCITFKDLALTLYKDFNLYDDQLSIDDNLSRHQLYVDEKPVRPSDYIEPTLPIRYGRVDIYSTK